MNFSREQTQKWKRKIKLKMTLFQNTPKVINEIYVERFSDVCCFPKNPIFQILSCLCHVVVVVDSRVLWRGHWRTWWHWWYHYFARMPASVRRQYRLSLYFVWIFESRWIYQMYLKNGLTSAYNCTECIEDGSCGIRGVCDTTEDVCSMSLTRSCSTSTQSKCFCRGILLSSSNTAIPFN